MALRSDPFLVEFIVNFRWAMAHVVAHTGAHQEEIYPQLAADIIEMDAVLSSSSYANVATLGAVSFGAIELASGGLPYLLLAEAVLGEAPATMHPFLAAAVGGQTSADGRNTSAGSTVDSRTVDTVSDADIDRVTGTSGGSQLQGMVLLLRWLVRAGVIPGEELALTLGLIDPGDGDGEESHEGLSRGYGARPGASFYTEDGSTSSSRFSSARGNGGSSSQAGGSPRRISYRRAARRLCTITPFYLGAHLLVTRSLLMHYACALLPANALAFHIDSLHVAEAAGALPSLAPPGATLEDSLVLWLQFVASKTRQDGTAKGALTASATKLDTQSKDSLDGGHREGSPFAAREWCDWFAQLRLKNDFYDIISDGVALGVACHFYEPNLVPARRLCPPPLWTEAAAPGGGSSGAAALAVRNWASVLRAAEVLGLRPSLAAEEAARLGTTALQLHVLRLAVELFAVLASSAEEDARVNAELAREDEVLVARSGGFSPVSAASSLEESDGDGLVAAPLAGAAALRQNAVESLIDSRDESAAVATPSTQRSAADISSTGATKPIVAKRKMASLGASDLVSTHTAVSSPSVSVAGEDAPIRDSLTTPTKRVDPTPKGNTQLWTALRASENGGGGGQIPDAVQASRVSPRSLAPASSSSSSSYSTPRRIIVFPEAPSPKRRASNAAPPNVPQELELEPEPNTNLFLPSVDLVDTPPPAFGGWPADGRPIFESSASLVPPTAASASVPDDRVRDTGVVLPVTMDESSSHSAGAEGSSTPTSSRSQSSNGRSSAGAESVAPSTVHEASSDTSVLQPEMNAAPREAENAPTVPAEEEPSQSDDPLMALLREQELHAGALPWTRGTRETLTTSQSVPVDVPTDALADADSEAVVEASDAADSSPSESAPHSSPLSAASPPFLDPPSPVKEPDEEDASVAPSLSSSSSSEETVVASKPAPAAAAAGVAIRKWLADSSSSSSSTSSDKRHEAAPSTGNDSSLPVNATPMPAASPVAKPAATPPTPAPGGSPSAIRSPGTPESIGGRSPIYSHSLSDGDGGSFLPVEGSPNPSAFSGASRWGDENESYFSSVSAPGASAHPRGLQDEDLRHVLTQLISHTPASEVTAADTRALLSTIAKQQQLIDQLTSQQRSAGQQRRVSFAGDDAASGSPVGPQGRRGTAVPTAGDPNASHGNLSYDSFSVPPSFPLAEREDSASSPPAASQSGASRAALSPTASQSVSMADSAATFERSGVTANQSQNQTMETVVSHSDGHLYYPGQLAEPDLTQYSALDPGTAKTSASTHDPHTAD